MLLVTGEEDREKIMAMGRAPESVFAVRGGVDLSIPRSVPEPTTKNTMPFSSGDFIRRRAFARFLKSGACCGSESRRCSLP